MKTPFGLRVSDGRMVKAAEVPHGRSCGCVCAGCGEPLTVRGGKVVSSYFSHAAGGCCANAFERAIQEKAKQLILDRQQLKVPSHVLKSKITGPWDVAEQQPLWFEWLTVSVRPEELVSVSAWPADLQNLGEQIPGILLALPDGSPLAIDISVNKPSDEGKFVWARENNLTALGIKFYAYSAETADELELALEGCLFHDSSCSSWWHYAGEAGARLELAALEAQVRKTYADTDAAFLQEHARQHALLEVTSFKISKSLSIRVSRSAVHCTLKAHGYFYKADPEIKQAVVGTARAHAGQYNPETYTWEFRPSAKHVVFWYESLISTLTALFGEPTQIKVPAIKAPAKKSSTRKASAKKPAAKKASAGKSRASKPSAGRKVSGSAQVESNMECVA